MQKDKKENDLISESVSLWLQSQKTVTKAQSTYSKEKMLRKVIWHLFFEIGSKKLSEVKQPLDC